MGASVSSNTVNSMIQSSISIINTYNQLCTVDAQNANNTINLQGCIVGTGGAIIINSNQAVNVGCLTNAVNYNTVSSVISQNMRQAAEAITQQFGFPNLAVAENFIEASVVLGETIANQYYNTCVAKNVNANNTINCNGVVNGLVEINSVQATTLNCTLTAKSVTDATASVISLLDQSSVAKEQATFLYVLYGILVFVAIIAYFLISIADNPLVQWIIVFIVFFFVISSIAYTAFSKSNGLFPYSKQ